MDEINKNINSHFSNAYMNDEVNGIQIQNCFCKLRTLINN